MIRDIHGNILPLGKTIRTLEETFLGITTLPSWLTVTGEYGVNSAIVGPEADYGYLQVNTDTFNNNVATLNVLPTGIDMSKVKEIILSVDSLVYSDQTVNIFISIMDMDVTKGVTIQEKDNAVEIVGRNATSSYTVLTNYRIKGLSEFKRRRNLILRLRSDGTVSLLEGDNVCAEVKLTSAQMDLSGVLYPSISVQTMNSAPQYLRLSRVALSIIHN